MAMGRMAGPSSLSSSLVVVLVVVVVVSTFISVVSVSKSLGTRIICFLDSFVVTSVYHTKVSTPPAGSAWWQGKKEKNRGEEKAYHEKKKWINSNDQSRKGTAQQIL